jgi:uncharacterized membrane protein HdeD (DUF308 family)
MMQQFARNWWAVLIRGLFGIALGLMAFFWPGATLAAIVMVFGIYAIVDGVFLIAAGARVSHDGRHAWPPVVEGILGVLIGLAALFMPLATALAFAFLVAAWAIVRGGMEIAAAFALRKTITGEWVLGAVGVLSILLGLAIFIAPGAGLLAWIWMVGAYGLVTGIMLIGLAFRLRSHRRPSANAGGVAEQQHRAA